MYELKVEDPQQLKDRKEDFKLIQFLFMKQVKQGKGFYGEKYSKTLPRMEFLDVNKTILEVKKQIFSKIKHVFKESHPIHNPET